MILILKFEPVVRLLDTRHAYEPSLGVDEAITAVLSEPLYNSILHDVPVKPVQVINWVSPRGQLMSDALG